MSFVVSSMVQRRVVGSPTRKAVLMFMAANASDDGSGVWTSKANMARDLEMGRRTVQVCIDDLTSMGLLREVGQKKCRHGFTVEYEIDLGAVEKLPLTRAGGAPHTQDVAGAGGAHVQEVHATRAGDARQDVQEVHMNNSGIVQEPCVEDTHTQFDILWSAHPRPKDRAGSLAEYGRAIEGGADPTHILASAKAYAKEQAGNGKQYVCGLDAWLRGRRWEDFDAPSAPVDTEDQIRKMLASTVPAVREHGRALAAKAGIAQ